MKRNEILKSIMLRKELCTADLARMTGIPYTTLKSIFERGVEKSGYASVCSICTALGITTDELERLARRENGCAEETGAGKRPALPEMDDLSEEEIRQVKLFLDYLRFLRTQKGPERNGEHANPRS